MSIDGPPVVVNLYDPQIRFAAQDFGRVWAGLDNYRSFTTMTAQAKPMPVSKWCDICRALLADKEKDNAGRRERVSAFIGTLPDEDRKWFTDFRKGLDKSEAAWLDHFIDGLTEKERAPENFSKALKDPDAGQAWAAFHNFTRPLENTPAGSVFSLNGKLHHVRIQTLILNVSEGNAGWARDFTKRLPEEYKEQLIERGYPKDTRAWFTRSLKALPEADREWFAAYIRDADDKQRERLKEFALYLSPSTEQQLARFEKAPWREVGAMLDELREIAGKNSRIMEEGAKGPGILERVNELRKQRGADPLKTGGQFPFRLLIQPAIYDMHMRNDSFPGYYIQMLGYRPTLKFTDPSIRLDQLQLNADSPGAAIEKVDAALSKGELWSASEEAKINDGHRVIAFKAGLKQVIAREKLRLEFAEEVQRSRPYLDALKKSKEAAAEVLAVRMMETYTFEEVPPGGQNPRFSPVFGKVKRDQIAIDLHAWHSHLSIYDYGRSVHIRRLQVQQAAKNKEEAGKNPPADNKPLMEPEHVGRENSGQLPMPPLPPGSPTLANPGLLMP